MIGTWATISLLHVHDEGYALRRGSWLAVVTTSKVFLALLYPNHPHPDPWTAAVLVLTSFFRFSNDPKSFSTWDLKVEKESNLVCSDPEGARFFQNSYKSASMQVS
jgi:hypothetical protein